MSIQKTNPIISESDDELAENPVGGLPIRIRNSDIQFQTKIVKMVNKMAEEKNHQR